MRSFARGHNVMIVAHRLGFVMANAGVDQSNISQTSDNERVLLLPRDPDRSAADLKTRFDKVFGIEAGVIINDSFGRPWRNGVVGVAIGSCRHTFADRSDRCARYVRAADAE